MPITAYTTTFDPKCGLTASNVSIRTDGTASNGASAPTDVTNAHSALDWFSISGTTNNLGATYAAMSTSTVVGVQNKAFVAAISQMAKTALLPLVKAEYFAATLAPNSISSITSAITGCNSALTNVQNANNDATTKTALVAAYTADAAVITAALNRIKTVENKIYAVGDSIDTTSTATDTAYAAIATVTSFTTSKIYLSNMFDPAYLGQAPSNTMPALTTTAILAGNAATLAGYYSAAATAIAASTTISQLQALTAMTANTVFDTYCADIQGYASSGTTGKYTGTAPVGIVPGIDYEIHITGAFQSGTAASGTPGAPSAVLPFWA
jgi:hypothetical protein